jgi:2-polyprenyl-3-methyl-5-hydroxy-6-metoxy-1,4-benzoquinol methylase
LLNDSLVRGVRAYDGLDLSASRSAAMSSYKSTTYNERLFSSGGIRSRFHLRRYHWLVARVRELGISAADVLDLGCYDAKTIDFLELSGVSIKHYSGFDANWEGGVEAAFDRWRDRPEVQIRQCVRPEEMILAPGELFDVAICMETLEHVPPSLVEPYLRKISDVLRGYLFVTVPIERGAGFLIKHSVKKLLGIENQEFSLREFVNSTLGRLHRVDRDDHKGFDDRLLVTQIAKYFDILDVGGIWGFGPLTFNFFVGIVAKSRRQGAAPSSRT